MLLVTLGNRKENGQYVHPNEADFSTYGRAADGSDNWGGEQFRSWGGASRPKDGATYAGLTVSKNGEDYRRFCEMLKGHPLHQSSETACVWWDGREFQRLY